MDVKTNLQNIIDFYEVLLNYTNHFQRRNVMKVFAWKKFFKTSIIALSILLAIAILGASILFAWIWISVNDGPVFVETTYTLSDSSPKTFANALVIQSMTLTITKTEESNKGSTNVIKNLGDNQYYYFNLEVVFVGYSPVQINFSQTQGLRRTSTYYVNADFSNFKLGNIVFCIEYNPERINLYTYPDDPNYSQIGNHQFLLVQKAN